MTERRRRATIAVLCCALGAPASVVAQPAPRSDRSQSRTAYQPVQMSPDAAADAPVTAVMHVAVVGSVSAPATYVFSARPTAADVLTAAGGLTQDAGDNLLIVRQGRILGPLLIAPQDRELSAAGPIFDGDVLVFKARRGVRTAHYQSSESVANGRRGVEIAMTPRAVHVACLGLDRYPVVLPLAESQATEQVLLLELLGITPAAAEQGVRRVSDGTYAADDGALHDGTVLAFDRRILGPQGVRPAVPLPPPREAALPAAPLTPPAAVPEPAPTAASAFESAPPQPLRIAADGQRLTEPLPGFPFVVRGDATPTVAVPAAAAFQSAPVLRGAGAVDVTQTPVGTVASARSIPSQSLLTSAEYQAVSPSEPRLPGIRAPVIARGPQPAGTIEPTLVGDDAAEVAAGAPVGSALESPVDLSILGGVLLAAACCLGASYIWAREERRRSIAAAGRVDSLSPSAVPTSPTTAPSALQELLDNELPIIEEPAAVSRPPRMFGPVVGQRRLMIDAPHAQVAAPHFALSRAASDQRRQQRYERHLTAVTAAPSRPAAPRPASVAAPAASTTFRYDVVEPESHSPAPPRHARANPAPGELLTRVLHSLSGES